MCRSPHQLHDGCTLHRGISNGEPSLSGDMAGEPMGGMWRNLSSRMEWRRDSKRSNFNEPSHCCVEFLVTLE